MELKRKIDKLSIMQDSSASHGDGAPYPIILISTRGDKLWLLDDDPFNYLHAFTISQNFVLHAWRASCEKFEQRAAQFSLLELFRSLTSFRYKWPHQTEKKLVSINHTLFQLNQPNASLMTLPLIEHVPEHTLFLVICILKSWNNSKKTSFIKDT